MNYKERMKDEYKQLKDRYYKLHSMLIKYETNTLDFELTCPFELLKEQEYHMKKYLNILKERAKLEKVNLD